MTRPARIAPETTSGTGAPDEPPYRYTARLADEIECRWQERWDREGAFRASNPGEPGFDATKPKFYCLDMFPYPSGAGLHVGHPEGYTATDIICRYKRHRGFNVLHPMGWDAFGLPAEQYAIQTGVHPAITTRNAIDNFRRQLKRFGFSYDWSREFATIDPDYYRWTQWIWLKAYGAWYDRSASRARPIETLEDRLTGGRLVVDAEGGVVEPSGAAGERRWRDLPQAEQRGVIDGQRLAYLGEQTVNWCPKLGTVLANEEIIDGRSERGGYPVHRKPLRQWLFRITAYADRLLAGLDTVEWPESTRIMQAEWIGRSEGAEVDFPLEGSRIDALRVYTTRPDTIFGATFMVVAPEHPLIEEVLHAPRAETDAGTLAAYVETARNRADVERMADAREKTGVFTGVYATNPATGERIAVWTADYVLMGYGHGAIMAVPAHDQRDYEFAERFGLPIVPVVRPAEGEVPGGTAFAGEGVAINSANDTVSLDGLPTGEAKTRITKWAESQDVGRHRVNYKLRDWLFSRQRYWGEPFPVVFDADGRHHPVAAARLPVELPPLDDYEPVESDDPVPLLAKATAWVETTAGAAGVDPAILPPDTPVRRETNTMPGWAGSCWYYLRYCDPKDAERFVSPDAERYWMQPLSPDTIGGVDLYVGGAEHAVLHLLYARFWHKLLFDLGEVSTPEPFSRLFHQGLITSYAFQRADKSLVAVDEVTEIGEPAAKAKSADAKPDPDGRYWIETATGEVLLPVTAKMSKSLRNVVNPDDIIASYGADTFRLYEMYMGPLEATKPWHTADIIGPFRFLQRVWRLAVDETTGALVTADERDDDVERRLHRTIRKVGEDIERLAFNTAIAAMIELINAARKATGLTRDQLERFAVILSPFAPHLGEEIWSRLGHETSIADAPWPRYDRRMIVDETVELPVQIRGKVRGRIQVPADADEAAVRQAALEDERIAELVEGQTIRKVIVVPGKIVNIIV